MTRSTRLLLAVAALVIATSLLAPTQLRGQMRAKIALFTPTPTDGTSACRLRDAARGDAWRALMVARSLDRDEARRALRVLEDSLAREAAARPTDVETQYLLAVAIGSRADVEGGRTKVKAAKALYAQTLVVLALDPDHPGAQHLLGRLHAAVLRMDRVTRFIATRLMGGRKLAGATWEEAQWRLETAAAGDPCVPDYSYELARLYAERGDPEAAKTLLRRLLSVEDPTGLYDGSFTKGRALLADLDRSR